VTFTDTPGLFAVVGLKQYLEDRLDLSVDLGMPDALNEAARRTISVGR
jgi:predicted nucleotidyltransferase